MNPKTAIKINLLIVQGQLKSAHIGQKKAEEYGDWRLVEHLEERIEKLKLFRTSQRKELNDYDRSKEIESYLPDRETEPLPF
jgi:hypothetical protein